MTAPVIVLELLHAKHGEYRRPCPDCDKGPRDVALAIKVDATGATWFCHRCAYTGACNQGYEARVVPGHKERSLRLVAEVPLRWSDRAQSIWARSMPLQGTVGEVYLKTRHCVIPPEDSDLRFLPATDNWPPCLVGRITDFMTNEAMSLHFTKLKTNGDGKAGTEGTASCLRGIRNEAAAFDSGPRRR